MDEVFLSYSRKDRKWVNQLLETFKPLIRKRNTSFWSDTKIIPGMDWHEEIKSSLDRSQVVILLISANYLTSKLVEEELSLILERSRKGKLDIFPVVISPGLAQHPNLKNSIQEYKLINSFAEPLSTLPKHKQDEILMRLYKAVDNVLSNKANTKTEKVDQPKDIYSTALETAITNIGGDTKGVNIIGENIFFEAEETLTQKNDK